MWPLKIYSYTHFHDSKLWAWDPEICWVYHCTMLKSACKLPCETARRLSGGSPDCSVATCKVPCHFTSITTSTRASWCCGAWWWLLSKATAPFPGAFPARNKLQLRNGNLRHRGRGMKGTPPHTPGKGIFTFLRILKINDFPCAFFKTCLLGILK